MLSRLNKINSIFNLLCEKFRIGRVIKSLLLIVFSVVSKTAECFATISLFKLWVACLVFSIWLIEKSIYALLFNLNILKSRAAPSTWHHLNLWETLRCLIWLLSIFTIILFKICGRMSIRWSWSISWFFNALILYQIIIYLWLVEAYTCKM